VLCYHAVEPAESDFTRGLESSITPDAFAEHLRFLAQHYRVVPMAAVERGGAPAGAVAITFDDGYRSVLDHAIPRLAERSWPSTHYLVTGAIGNRRLVWVNELTWFMWNHRDITFAALERAFGIRPGTGVAEAIAVIRQQYDSTALETVLETLHVATGVDREMLAREAQLYIDWRDVATMQRAGLTFGNHTATHPSLPRLSEAAQREEIERARRELEQRVGPVSSLAVPFGDVDERTRRAARDARHVAVAEVGGVNDGRDSSRIGRVIVRGRTAAELFAEMEVVTPVRAWLKSAVRGWRHALREERPDGVSRTAGREPRTGVCILYVWFSDYPWDVRAEKFCTSLTAAGHEVHLVARNRRRDALREERAEATVHRLAPWRWLEPSIDGVLQFPLFFNPRWTRLLRRVAREVKPDVIIARDLPLCPAAIRLGKRLGVPVVLDMAENYPAFMRTMREAGHHGVADGLLRHPRALAVVERWCLPRVDRVLAVVDESAARVARLGVPRDRVRIVSNTPARDRAERATAREHRNGRTRLDVVYLGLLETPRGIDDMIDAAALLRETATPIRVTLVGDGRDARELQARARAAGLAEADVVFAGQLPLATALDVVAQADVGVVPLRRCEAYDTTVPNKLFDYMALGLAVVTSDTLPSARIVRETGAGEVYRAGEAKDLAAALRRLADPAARRRAGEAGRQAVLEQYNWQRDAETLCATIDEVVRRPGRTDAPSAGSRP
jgi:glycosyltransferase involved in cell wall biosynthesis/peptidoglycan/xylan/chitin deacetylase (PgdA/CDA1 family)